MAKEPGAFICDPEHAGQLQRAHTLFAGGHKVIGEHPFVERNFGVFHDGANRHSEGLVALIAPMDAGPGAVPGKFRNAGRIGIATVATGDAIRPIQPLKVFAGFVGIGENRICKITHGLILN
jgi:hypothetical protein